MDLSGFLRLLLVGSNFLFQFDAACFEILKIVYLWNEVLDLSFENRNALFMLLKLKNVFFFVLIGYFGVRYQVMYCLLQCGGF